MPPVRRETIRNSCAARETAEKEDGSSWVTISESMLEDKKAIRLCKMMGIASFLSSLFTS